MRGSGTLAAVAILLLPASTAHAQGEAQLKAFFEGKTVAVKLDMPATDDGVDVYTGRKPPVDFGKYAKRLKDHGTALEAGESIVVTKVKVTKDLIEFQLGGGGFGTFGDDNTTDVYVPSTEKSRREKNLERAIKNETDPAKRREMSEELDQLRKERDRQDALLRATTASAEEAKRENVRQRALAGGSRFNLRYEGSVPASALTPESVMSALRDYVSFPPESFGGDTASPRAATDGAVTRAPGPGAAAPAAALRKGLTRAEVEAVYGKPVAVTGRVAGDFQVVVCTFLRGENKLTAEFVEDVLVRYSLSSR